MDISFLGHSSFRIKTKNVYLVMDPFDPKDVGVKFPTTTADIVTLSHEHGDHNYVEGVKDYSKVISAPGEYEVQGVSIIGFPSYHDKNGGKERGRNTVYIVESEGLRLAHLGDLGNKLSDKEIEELGEINILMIHSGGDMALSPSEAAEVVRAIEPQIVIPMHYFQQGMSDEKKKACHPVEEFLKEVGLPVEKMSKLSIKVNELGEGQKIVLFQ